MRPEEALKRIKKGPGESKQYDWEPERPNHSWTLPFFNIDIPKSNNGKKMTYDGLGKILAFIDIIKMKRFKSGCTVMPISTRNKKYLRLWNSAKGVSNAIERMKNYGLIELENQSYRHHAILDSENYSRTYRYYFDNERKLIDYCRQNGIQKYDPSQKTIDEKRLVKRMNEIDGDFEISSVRFSNDLHIVKPDGISFSDFENLLTICLKMNYPYYQLIQDKIIEINSYYDDERFKIKFEPTFHWSEREGHTNVLNGIVIRASNSFSNKKKGKRYWLKKRNGFVLEKDIKSSVPRLTLSLNLRKWVDEGTDIYKLIDEEYEPGHTWTKVRRDAIKKLHMWCYFDSGSDIEIGKNIWRHMDKTGASKKDVDILVEKMKKATIKAEGGKLYGVEIFFVESCIYLMVLYDLLKTGIKTWIVYDAFYSGDFEDREMFSSMIENDVKGVFEDFIKWHDINKVVGA